MCRGVQICMKLAKLHLTGCEGLMFSSDVTVVGRSATTSLAAIDSQWSSHKLGN